MLVALREISTPTATPRSSTSRSSSPTPLLSGKPPKSYAAVAASASTARDSIDGVTEETPLKSVVVDEGNSSQGKRGRKKKLAIA